MAQRRRLGQDAARESSAMGAGAGGGRCMADSEVSRGRARAATGAAVTVFAPAKINLYLRVTGRRDDGYHLLDSLAVFAAVGDRVTAAPGAALTLAAFGPEAAGLPDAEQNLALRAARLLAAETGCGAGAVLRLEKCLPVASGIGGGSTDAAATLHALDRLWELGRDAAALAALGARLGADLPVCLAARPVRMRGIGERLDPAPRLPEFGLVLANPRQALATQAVFQARDAAFSAPARLPEAWPDAAALARDIAALGNDLEAAARRLCPAIGEVRAALAALPGCLAAGMSGSGATCFAIFADAARAAAAAASLPDAWWRWGGGLHPPDRA